MEELKNNFIDDLITEDLEENPVIEKDLAEIRQETHEIDHALRQELEEEKTDLEQSIRKK